MGIDKSFIEKIEELSARVESISYGDESNGGAREYTNKRVYPVLLPEPTIVGIETLTGIKDYLTENPDGHELDQIIVHVKSFKNVEVFRRLTGPFEQRPAFLLASYQQAGFQFDSYMDVEKFIVQMQAQFVQDANTAKLLKLVGNLSDGVVKTIVDDGITQEATVKSGVARLSEETIPNPIILQPYRTFMEIEQPSSNFVVRLKSATKTGGETPGVALFEADGGRWKLEAVKRVRDWLRVNIPEEVTILA